MIVPSRLWFLVTALLALVAPLALVWPSAATVLLVVDAVWVAMLAVDVFRAAGEDSGAIVITRTAPPAFSLGKRARFEYRWQNGLSRRLKVEIREETPEVIALEHRSRTLGLAERGVVIEQLQLMPLARGKVRGGKLYLRIISPWRLAWRRVTRDLPWSSTVYPSLTGVSSRALPTQSQRRREVGLRNIRRLGEGRLFESLREWVPGDDTRTIDWKATARRGKPMVRQYEDERRQHVLIVIDAGRMLTARSGDEPMLESVVEAALQLAYAAVDHDDNVGLMVFADEVQHYITPARGQRALRAIIEALATTDGRLVEPNYPAAFAYLAARNRKRALTVLFTDVIDAAASDALVAHAGTLRPRHLPLAVTLRNPELDGLATARPRSVEHAFEKAAAEELLQSREEALASMRARGVLTLDVSPMGAAKAVVDQYHLFKRRGMI